MICASSCGMGTGFKLTYSHGGPNSVCCRNDKLHWAELALACQQRGVPEPALSRSSFVVGGPNGAPTAEIAPQFAKLSQFEATSWYMGVHMSNAIFCVFSRWRCSLCLSPWYSAPRVTVSSTSSLVSRKIPDRIGIFFVVVRSRQNKAPLQEDTTVCIAFAAASGLCAKNEK
jgi:hypothetical protein